MNTTDRGFSVRRPWRCSWCHKRPLLRPGVLRYSPTHLSDSYDTKDNDKGRNVQSASVRIETPIYCPTPESSGPPSSQVRLTENKWSKLSIPLLDLCTPRVLKTSWTRVIPRSHPFISRNFFEVLFMGSSNLVLRRCRKVSVTRCGSRHAVFSFRRLQRIQSEIRGFSDFLLTVGDEETFRSFPLRLRKEPFDRIPNVVVLKLGIKIGNKNYLYVWMSLFSSHPGKESSRE